MFENYTDCVRNIHVVVTGQLAECQLTYWTTRGLDISRTRQLAGWTTRGCHRRLCVLSFHFWPFIDVFLGVYLYAIRLVALCLHSPIMQLKQQILLLATSTSCPVRDLSSTRVD